MKNRLTLIFYLCLVNQSFYAQDQLHFQLLTKIEMIKNLEKSPINSSLRSIYPTDLRGNTALHYATINNDIEKMEDILKKSNTNINTRNYQSIRPLDIAAANNNHPATEILLDYGANPDLKDKFGFTSYDFTTSNQIKDLLENKMKKDDSSTDSSTRESSSRSSSDDYDNLLDL